MPVYYLFRSAVQQLVHADVFRPPAKYPMLFCVLVGTGVQLLCMGIVTIAFAAIGYVGYNRKLTGESLDAFFFFVSVMHVQSLSMIVSSILYVKPQHRRPNTTFCLIRQNEM